MKLRAILRFTWRSRWYEIGDLLEAEDVKARMMIADGLVEEVGSEAKAEVIPTESKPEPEATSEVSAQQKQSEPAMKEESVDSQDPEEPRIVTKKSKPKKVSAQQKKKKS